MTDQNLSDVAIALSHDAHRELVKRCLRIEDSVETVLFTLGDGDRDDHVLLHWQGISWDTSKPLIGAIQEFVGDLGSETFGFIQVPYDLNARVSLAGNPSRFGLGMTRRIKISE